MLTVETEDHVSKTLVVSVIIVIVIIMIFIMSDNSSCGSSRTGGASRAGGKSRRVASCTRSAPPEVFGGTLRLTERAQGCSERTQGCSERKYWSERDCLQAQIYSEVPKFEDVELYKFKDLRARQRYNEFIGGDACGNGRAAICDNAHYDITSPNLTNATLYSTADVDPLITGQLYVNSNQTRNVYAQRTSMGDEWGLKEYNSSGEPGDVGVDVGPDALYEYAGKRSNFDDGIPEQWAFPSTPIRWYAPAQRDYYGPEGPTVYSEGLYTLTEPDHIPKMP